MLGGEGRKMNVPKRKEIDLTFAGMQQDAEYQAEALGLEAEFEHADWESLELTETLS